MTSILLKNINCNGILSDIYIEGSRIKRIMPVGSAGQGGECRIASGVEVMDCEGKTAMPGFINILGDESRLPGDDQDRHDHVQ
mgnify:CR=1 FL=1